MQKGLAKNLQDRCGGVRRDTGIGLLWEGAAQKRGVKERRDGERRPFCKKAWRKTFKSAAAGTGRARDGGSVGAAAGCGEKRRKEKGVGAFRAARPRLFGLQVPHTGKKQV